MIVVELNSVQNPSPGCGSAIYVRYKISVAPDYFQLWDIKPLQQVLEKFKEMLLQDVDKAIAQVKKNESGSGPAP